MLRLVAVLLPISLAFSCQCNRVKESLIADAENQVAAAQKGDADAQYKLGMSASAVSDHKAAFEWFLKAAENGDARAQVEVAKRYNSGVGVPTDTEKALQWFTKAAEKGNVDGQRGLAVMYWGGLSADQRDLKKAEMWFEKAIAQGDEQSKKMLQEMKAEASPDAPNP